MVEAQRNIEGTSAKISFRLKVSIFPVCGVRLLADIKPYRLRRPSLQSEKNSNLSTRKTLSQRYLKYKINFRIFALFCCSYPNEALLLVKLKNPIPSLQKRLRRIQSKPIRGKKDLTATHVLQVTRKRTLPTFRQWKQLPHVFSKTEKITSLVSLGIIASSVVFVTFWFVATHRVEVPAVGGEYTEGLIGEPQFINPLYSATSDVDSDITSLIYSGLFRYDPISGLVPDLASSFEISDDQTTYTITLREDAKWHDGEKVRASDVVFTFQSIQNPDYKSPLSVTFRNISIAQVDEKTVQFVLPEPFAPFLSTLTVGIIPSHIWEEISAKRATLTDLNLTPIGSGPYKFEKFTKDKKGNIRSYTLVRNPDYYANPALIERLQFKFYPDAASALDALENRNIEGVGFIPTDLVTEVNKIRGVEILRPSIPQITVLFFNQEKNSILKELNIRTALAHATNKEAIIDEVLGGYGASIDGPILPGMIGYHENITKLDYDIEMAKSLLEQEGWTLADGSTVRTKEIDDETVELSFVMTILEQAEFIHTAEILQKQWSEAGIRLDIRVIPATDLQASVLNGRNYEIFLTGELLGIDPDPFPFWHSSQINDPGLNLALYANRNADTLLEQARVITDPNERAAKYIEFQNYLAEDVPAIFLYQPTYRYGIATKIENVILDRIMTPADRFSRVNEWYIKTKMKLQWSIKDEEEASSKTSQEDTAEKNTEEDGSKAADEQEAAKDESEEQETEEG